MSAVPLVPSLEAEVAPATAAFYRRALRALNDAGISFLVGGAFAHACFTGIRRATKDLDLFIRRADWERIAHLMAAQGWRAVLTHPHWLGKVHAGEDFIDLIFNSGNGLAPIDDGWFQGNARAHILGEPVCVANMEDSLLSKAFIMERERFDGADIAHLLQANAERIAWPRLLARFGPHWRVLLAHLVLFGYVYPGERQRLPGWLMDELLQRARDEQQAAPRPEPPVCAGTLLSRQQYLHDVEQLGYLDGRLTPASTMTPEDVRHWTRAIEAPADAQPVPSPHASGLDVPAPSARSAG